MMEEEAFSILVDAVHDWKPVAIVSLYSGGYDSAVATHVAMRMYPALPVWSIDTNLSADGWHEYVTGVARQFNWNHAIYDNQAGYQEFETWVSYHGCPHGPAGHSRAYQRLKERALYRLLAQYKQNRTDKVLFVTGIRRAESARRAAIATPVNRVGHSNIIFVNPLLNWSDLAVTQYRWTHEIPENPFYATVKGSGDCQCNWGNFITYERLQRYAPTLAAGNVGRLHALSRDLHGYGWDGIARDQLGLFDEGVPDLGLCSSCSRDDASRIAAAEWRALQEG